VIRFMREANDLAVAASGGVNPRPWPPADSIDFPARKANTELSRQESEASWTS